MKKSIFSALCLVLLATTTQSAWGATNGDVFKRIDSASELSDGDEIIFVNQAETYACGTKQNTNNRTPVSITTSNNAYTYTSSDNVQVFVVKVNGSNFGFHTGSGYIYSASSSSNNLRTNTTAASTLPTTTSAWTISVSNYVFTIQNVSNKSYYLAFNSTTYFSQYKSGQSKPYIYKKSGTPPTTLYLGQEMELFWNPARRFAVFGTPPVASLLVPFKRGQCFFLRAEAILLCGLPFLRGVPVGRRVENNLKS